MPPKSIYTLYSSIHNINEIFHVIKDDSELYPFEPQKNYLEEISLHYLKRYGILDLNNIILQIRK